MNAALAAAALDLFDGPAAAAVGAVVAAAAARPELLLTPLIQNLHIQDLLWDLIRNHVTDGTETKCPNENTTYMVRVRIRVRIGVTDRTGTKCPSENDIEVELIIDKLIN